MKYIYLWCFYRGVNTDASFFHKCQMYMLFFSFLICWVSKSCCFLQDNSDAWATSIMVCSVIITLLSNQDNSCVESPQNENNNWNISRNPSLAATIPLLYTPTLKFQIANSQVKYGKNECLQHPPLEGAYTVLLLVQSCNIWVSHIVTQHWISANQICLC